MHDKPGYILVPFPLNPESPTFPLADYEHEGYRIVGSPFVYAASGFVFMQKGYNS